MKNYIGISRDHSGSMHNLAKVAARDYNDNITAIREAAITHYLDTIVSVVECGIGSQVRRAAVNSSVTFLRPLDENAYVTDGQTPLFDSVGELIEIFEQAPDRDDPNVSFLIMAVTDGCENASRYWGGARLAGKIKTLQATDRWTFVFRVPKGQTHQLRSLGIPEGNILEWDTSERGVKQASEATRQAFTQYYTARASGQRSTGKFYADLSQVSTEDVKASLKDISKEVVEWNVPPLDDGSWIQHFCEKKLRGEAYLKGAAFYQMSKTETIQDHKRLLIRDKRSGVVYEGYAARLMLGLPKVGQVRVRPGDFGKFDLFVQSTSYNRKLVAGTQVIYWKGVMRAAA